MDTLDLLQPTLESLLCQRRDPAHIRGFLNDPWLPAESPGACRDKAHVLGGIIIGLFLHRRMGKTDNFARLTLEILDDLRNGGPTTASGALKLKRLNACTSETHRMIMGRLIRQPHVPASMVDVDRQPALDIMISFSLATPQEIPLIVGWSYANGAENLVKQALGKPYLQAA